MNNTKMPISQVENIDCMLAMKKFPDNFFDLAIVDPEYGIGASKPSKKPHSAIQKNGTRMSVKNNNYKHKDWDDKPASNEYFDELIRVSKNQIIWGVNFYDRVFGKGRIVWDKVNGNNDQFDCEIAYNSTNERIDLIRFKWAGMMQGKSIKEGHIQQGNKKLNEKRIHPCQKPVVLYGWMLQNYAQKGFKILDTHLGSGSSRIACYKLGFDFYGYEIDKDIFQDQENRFKIEKPLIDAELNFLHQTSNTETQLNLL